jgi:hypothetical protein
MLTNFPENGRRLATRTTSAACVASVTIRNAGEFNGFLKPMDRLFAQPLQFVAGELVLPAEFRPVINRTALAAQETASERFVPSTAGWTGRIN